MIDLDSNKYIKTFSPNIISIHGEVEIILKKQDTIIEHFKKLNTVVDSGIEFLTYRAINIAEEIRWNALGVGATNPDPAQTSLVSETDRILITSLSYYNNILTLDTIWGTDLIGYFYESGIFGTWGGNDKMIARTIFPRLNKDDTMTLEIIWKIIFGRS